MFRRTLKIAAVMALPAAALLGGGTASAQVIPSPTSLKGLNAFCIDMFNSGQQPRPSFESREKPDGMTTILNTASGEEAIFPPGDAFGPNPPNLLPTVYENSKTCRGTPIPNTLPSTPENPYNLHDDPVITVIDKTSPTDDLDWIMDKLEDMSRPHRVCRNWRGSRHCFEYPRRVDKRKAKRLAQYGVDIIEGNDLKGRLKDREYEGFPLLHYLGGLKEKAVDPVTKSVTINQIWYDSHIESDTAYVDPSVVDYEEWTIKYNIKILNRGHEDFAPYMMVYDDQDELNLTDVGGPDLTAGGTRKPRIPNVGLDQTFFPMEEGLMYTLNMKMPPARMWNLTYHWGWRVHPPRVQVTENVTSPVGPFMRRNQAEIDTFGANPRASEEAKLAAISMIGDTAPSKRMWRMFKEIADGRGYGRYRTGRQVAHLTPLLRQAFYDWQNRNQLPTGYKMADDVDMTLLFINNTIYGEVRGHDGDAQVELPADVFSGRGDQVKVQLLNGDFYLHAYVLVDFGGLRGWENTFHNTLPIGGAGPLFTFGRNHFWIHVAGQGAIPIPIATRLEEPPATPYASYEAARGDKYMRGRAGNPNDAGEHPYSATGGLMQPVDNYVNSVNGAGEHKVIINFNYEPSRRLRMYQFDALHHDTAIWSVH